MALLAARGYEVVASSGKADEHPWLRSLGATAVIGRDDVDEAGGRVLGPEHWAGAVDCVGGVTLARVLQSLRYGAAVAASGLTAGTALETTVYAFITRGVALLGVDSVRTPTPARRALWDRLATDLRPAHLDAMVAGEVTLEGLPGALADILAARIRGRMLVRLDRRPLTPAAPARRRLTPGAEPWSGSRASSRRRRATRSASPPHTPASAP